MSQFYSLNVSAIDLNTADAVVLTLDVPVDLSSTFEYLAGQYISLELTIDGVPVRRSYSICSSPSSNLLKVGVKEVRSGVFSTYANQKLKVGDQILVSAPEGRFVYPNKTEQSSVMAIAAGSGITPIMSILKSVLQEREGGPFTLVYGNKTPEKTMFYKELRALEQAHPERLTIHWVFSQSNEAEAHFGRIDQSILNYALNKSSAIPSLFYLCGPEVLIRESEKLLKEKGVEEATILYELFTSSPEKNTIKNRAEKGFLYLTCDEVTHALDLVPGKTILDIALQAKLDVPYSCQGGVCSSCIGKITEGKAEMETNQILTEDEIQQGLVLTCQAVAQSESIRIDYDNV